MSRAGPSIVQGPGQASRVDHDAVMSYNVNLQRGEGRLAICTGTFPLRFSSPDFFHSHREGNIERKDSAFFITYVSLISLTDWRFCQTGSCEGTWDGCPLHALLYAYMPVSQ